MITLLIDRVLTRSSTKYGYYLLVWNVELMGILFYQNDGFSVYFDFSDRYQNIEHVGVYKACSMLSVYRTTVFKIIRMNLNN